MRTLFFITLFFALSFGAKAQAAFPLMEGETQLKNGIEVSYRIMNHRERSIGRKGDFERYEVAVVFRNVSGEGINVRFNGGETDEQLNKQQYRIARAECLNATGYRMTSKFLEVFPEEHLYRITHYVQEEDEDGKRKIVKRTENLTVGYHFTVGEVREVRMVVIVPEGEKPVLQCQLYTN